MKLGTNDVDNIMLGDTQVDRIYLGTELAWDGGSTPPTGCPPPDNTNWVTDTTMIAGFKTTDLHTAQASNTGTSEWRFDLTSDYKLYDKASSPYAVTMNLEGFSNVIKYAFSGAREVHHISIEPTSTTIPPNATVVAQFSCDGLQWGTGYPLAVSGSLLTAQMNPPVNAGYMRITYRYNQGAPQGVGELDYSEVEIATLDVGTTSGAVDAPITSEPLQSGENYFESVAIANQGSYLAGEWSDFTVYGGKTTTVNDYASLEIWLKNGVDNIPYVNGSTYEVKFNFIAYSGGANWTIAPTNTYIEGFTYEEGMTVNSKSMTVNGSDVPTYIYEQSAGTDLNNLDVEIIINFTVTDISTVFAKTELQIGISNQAGHVGIAEARMVWKEI